MQYRFVIQYQEENNELAVQKKNFAKKLFDIPLSTVRAIIKKFKRYGTVENLIGRGHNCILPPRILGRKVREATKSLRITVKEL